MPRKPRTWTRWALLGERSRSILVLGEQVSREAARFVMWDDEILVSVAITEVLPKPQKFATRKPIKPRKVKCA